MFAFEVSIHQKAMEILKSQGFRELLKFSTLFAISLPQMLKESRTVTIELIKDWKNAFGLLHEQFGWPYPSTMFYGNQASVASRRSSKSSLVDTPEVTDPLQVMRNSIPLTGAMVRKRDELRHLLKACMAGEFWELALLLATILTLQQEANHALTHIPEYIGSWQLCVGQNAVYKSFVARCIIVCR